MRTVHDLTTRRNTAVTHYAHYGDLYGTAELVNGTGYLFRREGERKAILVAWNDPELLLHGTIDEEAEADDEPLWKKIATPGYYAGRQHRTLVNGR